MMNKFVVINLLLFQLAWFTCALYSQYASWILPFILGLHFLIFKQRLRDLKMFLLGLIGIMFDFLMFQLSIITFDTPFFPIWLCLLWLMFTLSLSYCFAWMRHLNLGWVALIGAVFGSLSYFAAAQLGAMGLGVGVIEFLIIYAIGWAFLLPLMVYLTQKPFFKINQFDV